MSRYLKSDSELGYIDDYVEIQYLKFNNLRHSVLGFMLGSFNDDGEYVVDEEIKKELISMKKYYVDILDNIEICQSEIKLDKPISFLVVFEGNKASLVLVEKLSFEANFKLNSGSYSNINEYVLDEIETSGEINRNAVYQRWNIHEFGGLTVDIFNCDPSFLEKYFGIVGRFKYLLEANAVLLSKSEETEEIEAGYANGIFKILKHYPKFETAVKTQLKNVMVEKKDFFKLNKAYFAKTFNELLNNTLEANKSILTEEERKQFGLEQRELKNATVVKYEKAIDISKTQNVDKIKTREVGGMTIAEIASNYVETNKNVESKLTNKKNGKEVKKLIDVLKDEVGISLVVEKETKQEKKEEVKEVVAPIKAPKAEKKADNLVAKATEKKTETKKEKAKKTDKNTDKKTKVTKATATDNKDKKNTEDKTKTTSQANLLKGRKKSTNSYTLPHNYDANQNAISENGSNNKDQDKNKSNKTKFDLKVDWESSVDLEMDENVNNLGVDLE